MSRRLDLTHTVFNREQLAAALAALEGAPLVALAGRSNVGKSSLVNCLAGRRQLAKTSSTPGKTRSLNFFRVEPQGYVLVDLPGYGYARTSQAERQAWAKLIDHFLATAKSLRAVAALLDCRLPPQRLDLELTAYLRQRNMPVVAVLTKADAVSQRERARRQQEWQELLHADLPPVLVSAKTGLGREKLWERLDEAAGCDQEPTP